MVAKAERIYPPKEVVKLDTASLKWSMPRQQAQLVLPVAQTFAT